jgi:hypothetical protein
MKYNNETVNFISNDDRFEFDSIEHGLSEKIRKTHVPLQVSSSISFYLEKAINEMRREKVLDLMNPVRLDYLKIQSL